MTLAGGTKLGPYEILSPIGKGGMGEVYRAKDTRLDREVAIKVLPETMTRDKERVARFEREAKSISNLTHPNICTLHDIGLEGDVQYLVMEYIEGDTLAQRLTKGALPMDDVLRIGAEIALALDKAHRAGVVHRDLKPGNIILAASGAKLLDFGLAKSAGGLASSPDMATMTEPLTGAGVIVGTFLYMAPEQLEGKEADGRTDIFAFGAVLYEMATGRRAFEGGSRASLIASIMSSEPRSISQVQPMTPPAFERVVRRCLAKTPDARWQNAGDLADELRWIAEGGSSSTAVATEINLRPRRGIWTGWLGGAALTAIIASIIALSFWNAPSSTPGSPTHLSFTLPENDVVDAGLENLVLAISPDGRSIAYCGRRKGKIQLYIRRLDQRDTTPLDGTDGAYDPFFSPDGKWLGYFSGDQMRKIDLHGGVSIPLGHSIESRSGSWTSDEGIVFAPTFASPLMRVAPSGGTPQPVSSIDSDKHERSHRWPEVLPGGEWVMFTVGIIDSPGGYDDANIDAVSIVTGERRTLVHRARMARYAPPGYLVFARKDVLLAAPMDPRDPKIETAPIPVFDGVGGEETSGASHFSISQNGSLAYVPGGSLAMDELVWMDRGGNIEPINARIQSYEFAQLSPDGKQLLVLTTPQRVRGDIWKLDVASGAFTRLTFNQNNSSPFWTPDQRRMVYRTEDSEYQIVVQPIDGSAPPQVIHSEPEPVIVSGISPDGKTVLFHRYGAADANIRAVAIDGSEPARTLWEQSGQQYGGTISPDGAWLAYTSVETGTDEIYIRPATGQGGKWQASTDGGHAPLWGPEGKELFYTRGTELISVGIEAGENGLAIGAPNKLFDLPPGRRSEKSFRGFDIHADGTKFVVIRTATPGSGRRQINVVLNWTEELKTKVPLDGR